jgi:predicted ATPase/DNA-binding SARP family transcriptional activator
VDVRALGPLEVVDGAGVDVTPGGAKPRALLARLAIETGRVIPTERLIEDLWGDAPPRSAANSLQGLVVKLRRSLGADTIATTAVGYRLALPADAVDIRRFDAAVAAARDDVAADRRADALAKLDGALALWRGAPLVDFAYEDWATAEIARLDELHVAALEARFSVLLDLGRHAEAVTELEVATARHPLREGLRSQLMLALYRCGRQADALRAFQDLRRVLGEELGLEPGVEVRGLEAAILAHDPSLAAPATVTTSGAAASGSTPAADGARAVDARTRTKTNLRAPLTALVGRTAELNEIDELLREHRLLTISGPGGAGKTRLAVEVARAALSRVTDGVWLVELAPLTDGADVPLAVASALGLADPSVEPRARLTEFLATRDVLLVLDNCEHVVGDVAALVEELLTAGPDVRLLCTSRENLAIGGEVVWVAPPLDDADAVVLFRERARAVQPGFDVDDANRDSIVGICRRLDGMPLAIELAAARTRAFSLTQLSDRLGDRFRLLTSGARTALPRQQTLRAVVEWSHQMLFDDERLLFERLSVFAGRCNLAAVEAVCSDERLPAEGIAETMARLVDKSVVQVGRDDGGSYFVVLQTLAQFGREQLDEDEIEQLRERHCLHFAAFASHGRHAYRGDRQEEWLEELRLHLDDVRAALAWAVDRRHPAALLMIAGLGWWWWVAAGVDEGWRWASAVFERYPLDETGPDELEDRAVAMTWGAFLGLARGRDDPVGPLLDEAEELTRSSTDHENAPYRILVLARVAAGLGQFDRAARMLDDADAHADRLADGSLPRAIRLYVEGQRALLSGRPDDGLESLRRAAALFIDVHDRFSAVICMTEMSFAAESAGRYPAMADALRQALTLIEPLRLTSFELVVRARLGAAEVELGNHDDADTLLTESVRVARDVAYRPALAFALNGLARLRHLQDRMDEAESAALQSVEYRLPDQPTVRASSLLVLGHAAAARGDDSAAAEHYAASLAEARRANNAAVIAAAGEGLARVGAATASAAGGT